MLRCAPAGRDPQICRPLAIVLSGPRSMCAIRPTPEVGADQRQRDVVPAA